MKSIVRAVMGVGLSVATLSLSAPAWAQGSPDMDGKPYEYDYLFPIFGSKLAQRGVRFPLPWGFGVNYAYMNQEIAITDISLAANDSDFANVTDFVEFERVRSTIQAVNARLDLWIFPFLSVYGLGNYAFQASTDVVLSEPFSFDAGANQQGYGGGFGFTGAFGAWGFFATIDMNWTWNKMQLLSVPVRTFLFTPRIGKTFHKWLGGVAFWVGTMGQVIQADTTGSISLQDAVGGENLSGFKDQLSDWYEDLPPLRQAVVDQLVERVQQVEDPTIHYRLDKRVTHPWNLLLGTEVGLTDAWKLRAEVGFIGRTQVVIGVNYRFGLFGAPQSAKVAQTPAPRSQGK